MGVPKFFRYISERYPCLSEKLKEYQIPEFDNLYLDMNGIIHNCSHPNDADVSFRITEETIFKNIFHYIEILFRIVQPQKLFFLAVDGVAPRAKINQQRGRRFRAAKDAEVQEAKAKAKGQEIPKEARFDSNCITPGTVFMSRLNEQLKYFITYKISTDKLWSKCKVILSGSEVPGEGEHKIMDYIRFMKAQPNYEGNTRHCLYGLDADLIMLGLCSHEPHFSLLREEVKFGKQQKKILTPEETNFCLLHLSLMREYLEHEFSPVKSKLSFKFDIEKIIDDWILMGFLVGNDFIPHLPNLHIENGALPTLYNAYMEVLPSLNGYINEAGTLNLERFEKFMEKLSGHDMEQFDEIYADLKYFEGKTGRRMNEGERNSKSSPDENASPRRTNNKALNALIMATEDELGETDEDDEEVDSDDDTDMQLEFTQHKRDYYMNKMEYEKVDAEIMRSQAEGYIRAIQWNLHYYYNGCCSWSWYYPHHYAPYISDIKNFKDLKLEFDMGTPFLPFEQLLAVLPAASKTLLPDAYHGLMTEENSPIIKYYPIDFKTDLNGKRQEWEAVVLIPLIDEKSLLEAMEPCNAKLTADERKRNSHGPMAVFEYTDADKGLYDAPQYFPSIRSHANMQLVKREEILIPLHKLVKGLCKGVQLSVYYPGFPTLQHIPHTSALEKAKVKVFEQPSRKESMMLTVLPKEVPDLDDLAQRWLGKTVFVSWPHLIEALVVGVANTKKKITIQHPPPKNSDGSRNFITENITDPLLSGLNVHKKSITETHRTRFGIDVGKIDIVVHACPIIGRQYVYSAQGKMTLEKQWNDNPIGFAYQVVLRDITVHNPEFIQFTSITEVFKPKSICFMLGHPYYGARGEVVEPAVDLKTSRIKVAMNVAIEPNFDRARQQQAETRLRYMPGNIAAQRLGISSHLLSRITGTILVINGNGADPASASKHNLGLNLKYNKKNEEVAGFTRKDHNSVWLYSTKAVDFVRSYMAKFPELFERFEQNLLTSDMFQRDDLFPQDGEEGVEAAVTWLKEQQKALNTTTRACGYDSLESDVVKTIEKDIDDYLKTQEKNSKTVIMHVKPHLLYKPGLNSGNIAPDTKSQHRLFDRIICVRDNFTVPLGYKGTIVGVQKGDNPLLNMYEVLFDKPFVGGIVIHECSPNRACRLAPSDFINISYGIQAENKNNVNKVNVPSPTNNWRNQQQQQSQQMQQNSNNRFPNNQNEQRNSWRQPPPPQQQPQAPDASALNSFYPAFTGKNGQQQRNSGNRNQQQQQNKIGFNESPSHQRRQQNTQFPQPPIVLQRGQDAGRKPNNPPPQQQQQQQQKQQQQQQQQQQQGGPKVVQGVTEFQALWNELTKMQDKMQKPVDSPNRQAPLPPQSDKPNPPSSAVKDSPQDPSAFLKAMLKISDESAQTSSSSSSKPAAVPAPGSNIVIAAAPVQPPSQQQQQQQQQPPAPSKPVAFPQTTKTTDNTPPLVQQLFDQARQAEKSGKNIWYCSQLLSHFQLLGTGFPRYAYCPNKDGTVCAQIILPDMRTFCGEFCRTSADAAESAAKKVYEELGLGKAPPPNMRPNPLRPPPPQQWFNPRMGGPAPPGPGPNVRQPPPPQANVKPMLPAGFPQVPMQAPMMHAGPMMPPMPKWSPMVPQNPNFPAGPKPPMMNQNRFPHQQQQQQMHHQQAQNNQQQMPQDNRNKTELLKKSTNFVPLQAQKKTRNVKKPMGDDRQQSFQQRQPQERKETVQQNRFEQNRFEQNRFEQNRFEQKPKENAPKEMKQEKSSPNRSSDPVNPNNQSQNAQQKSQKSAKPKKSRVAAKFLSDPVSNGDRQ